MSAPRLFFDKQGATVVEFAVALPVLVVLMIGILQYGIVLHTSGGLRNALGEGIRHAKVFPNATEASVLQKTRDALVGINPGGITALTFERGVSNGAAFGRLTVSYQAKPVIPFVPVQVITLTETKTAYLPS